MESVGEILTVLTICVVSLILLVLISGFSELVARKKQKKLFSISEFEEKTKKEFNIDEFNEWFKTEFDGYDGRKGAAGIFLRLDKFSSEWVKIYLKYIGQEPTWEDVQNYYNIVRKDWVEKLNHK